MNSFETFLTWLDGKKMVIVAIGSAILSYCVSTNLITADLGSLLQSILSILAGGALIATNNVLGTRNTAGVRIKTQE